MSNLMLVLYFAKKKMSVHKESEILKTESIGSTGSKKSVTCDRKCIHQGDRICYNDEGNKEIIKKIPDDSIQTESTPSIDADSVRSGESLFKTFSFDTQDNDPDLEKCMSFWKSILSKNVKPIKCTLLKSKKPKEKVDKEEKTKLKPCEDEETKKMWLNIYKDLQRRKLDKLKLMKKQICDPCADYIDEEYEKKQEKEDIQKLNNWTSQNKPSRFGKSDVRSQIQRTLKVLQAARNSKDIQKSSETVPPSQLKKEPSTAPVTSSQNEQSVRSNHLITSSKEKLQSRSIPSFETKLAMEKSRERVVTRKQLEICCTCGCAVEECICAEISDVIGVEGLKHEKIIPKGREKFADCCRPCSCSVDCVCDEFTDQNQVCSCGCRVEECICQNLNTCTCGCKVDECICQNLDEKYTKECSCGCGTDECICQQLFTRSCKCGHSDCNCDMIEILSTYLETLKTSPGPQGNLESDELNLISTQTQTGETQWVLETTQKQGSYCVICGHFNCYCKLDTKTPI